MNRAIGGVLGILLAIALACDVETPSSPSGGDSQTTATSSSQQPTGETTTTAPPTPPTNPTGVVKMSWGEARYVGDRVCISVRNDTGKTDVANLLSYDIGGIFQVGVPQDLLAEKVKTLANGQGDTLCVKLAKCNQWDLLQGDGEAPDPYTPNENWEHYGFVYLTSNIDDEECKKPPCDLDELRRKARAQCKELGYTINEKDCTFKCKENGCELGPESCDAPYVFDPEPCECVCDPKLLQCESPWIPNSTSCTCECDDSELRELARANCEWGVKSLDYENCEYECKTCEEANKPSHTSVTYSVTSTHITADYSASHGGHWKLDLWAGYPGNQWKWNKDDDDARPKCGETKDLHVKYRHKGHGACLWTLTASGPGFSYEKVVLDRCPK